MRTARPIRIDFAARAHGAPRAGAALLAAGLAAALAVGVAFERALAERDRLEALAGVATPARRATSSPDAAKAAAEAAAVARELAVPWTRLLAELEAASHDGAASVAVLEVEPDVAKQRVRITAEVRALNDALAWLRRLQRTSALRHPMLESHERRKDDPEHPLRVKLSAEWRT